MMQYLKRHIKLLLVVFGLLIIPSISFAAWYHSSQSGVWTAGATWSKTSYPNSGDGVVVESGTTVTYEGVLSWTGGQIEVDGGTLIINGDLDLSNVSLYIKNGGTLIVNGNLITNRSLSINGTLTVTGNVSISGDLGQSSGELTVGGSLTVSGDHSMSSGTTASITGSYTVNNSYIYGVLWVGGDATISHQLSTGDVSAVVDVDGSVSTHYIYVNSGIVVIDENLTVSGQLGADGILVVGGDYQVISGAATYVSTNHFFVFGSDNCTSGNCSNIGDQAAWEAQGSPGEAYINTTSTFWDDHLSNAGNTEGMTKVCSSTTFKVEAVTTNAGNLENNLFEWAVYGGTIASFNGAEVTSNSTTYEGHTASYLGVSGVGGTSTYTITVDWTETDFDGAYVAVRQTSEDGCTDGLWSVYTIEVGQDNVAPVIGDLVDENATVNTINCTANATINFDFDAVTDDGNLVFADPAYRYTINGVEKTGNSASISDEFPVGETIIYWTVEDMCGNTSEEATQKVMVSSPISITPITYDDNSSATGAGSGIQPVQTSTHTYEVDGGSAEAGYSYSWQLFADANEDGLVDNYSSPINSGLSFDPDNDAQTAIEFSTLASGSYVLVVTKSSGCSATAELPILVIENSYNAVLADFGDHCQAGETDTPTTMTWEVTFSGNGTAPYNFDYTVDLMDDGGTSITACSGSVSGITQTALTADLTLTSGCSDTSTMPFMQVLKTDNSSYKVQLKYTIQSVTATNFKINISIAASDTYSVHEISEQTVGENSEELTSSGVPNTSEIQTD
ncbi:G8 domain-containing protein [Mangrovibacterium diazotrophicum]|uniref:G8 domain-containing protein n=1 Tax=Mangrovibacterium diazotrophicum TaxID=1261403 RepID=A0A419W8U9_9BACT|nr:G8 domain-containing protein [Mangrovibacterium diazotrophicum]RKD91854.1 G8 domain-containing protein [Mangrovibacterium diazotrophicum]